MNRFFGLSALFALVVALAICVQNAGAQSYQGNYGIITGFAGGSVSTPLLAPTSASTTVAPGYAFAGAATTGYGFSSPYLYLINQGTRVFYADTTGMQTDGNFGSGGTITSTRTTDVGWSIVAGANTACNTTCTSACVAGFDAATSNKPVVCTDATADLCLCAGSS